MQIEGSSLTTTEPLLGNEETDTLSHNWQISASVGTVLPCRFPATGSSFQSSDLYSFFQVLFILPLTAACTATEGLLLHVQVLILG